MTKAGLSLLRGVQPLCFKDGEVLFLLAMMEAQAGYYVRLKTLSSLTEARLCS